MKKSITIKWFRVFVMVVLLSTATTMVANDESQNNAVPCPVEISSDIVNGTLTVDKAEALAGDTVTITVTPDYGYSATSSDVSIELTIDPSISHAPHRTMALALGDIFHPTGDTRATHDFPATYSFVMPDYPLSVLISANFTQLTKYRVAWVAGGTTHSLRLSTSNGQYWGGDILEGTLVTATITLTPPEDFFVVGLSVLDYNNEDRKVEVTDHGNGIFTFTMPNFDIVVRGMVGAYMHGVRFDADNHWATYYGDYVLKVPDGVQAYVVTAVTDTEVQLELLTDGDDPPFIPWEMGVLLYSETPMEEVTTVTSGRASWDYTSMLKGSLEDTEMTSGYVLYGDKFIRARAGTLPAHRCYLPLDSVNSNTSTGAPRMLTIKRPGEGGVITGVEGIKDCDVVSVKYVNMMGIVSDEPFRGVNIAIETLSDGRKRTAKVVK